MTQRPPIPPPEIREVRASDLIGCELGQILVRLWADVHPHVRRIYEREHLSAITDPGESREKIADWLESRGL